MHFFGLFHNWHFFTSVLLLIGFITLIYNIYRLFFFIYRKFLRNSRNIYQTYGDSDSWAVVTGSSDGIGKAFSESLAEKGFNICFIARNLEKTESVRKEIQTTYPKLKTSIIIADFEYAPQDPISFFQKINEEFTKQNIVNIAVLINNVGYSDMAHFEKVQEKEIVNMLAVNIYPVSFLSRIVIPKMLDRNKKSLIINLSSAAGKSPCPFLCIYGASKSFNDILARSLALEFEGKIDVMSLKPNWVSTKMSKLRPGGLVITAKQCVEGCFRDVGFVEATAGNWRHDVVEWLLINVIPKRFLLKRTNATMKRIDAKKKKE